jgi:putative transposase
MPYWRLGYHFVWSVKNRLPLILPEYEKRLYKVIAAKTIDLGGTVFAIGGMEDHIHLAVSVPPKLSLARFVGDVKGNASHFINHVVLPESVFYWQEEYGVISFGESEAHRVVAYIRNQRDHHRQGCLLEELEREN